MQYISSNKKAVQILIQECLNHGVRHAIISPGSRNAPLIIAFDNHPNITCYSIPDERSAAFYALGMARQLNEPVAIICTSGTALLNYAPALTEAYYQEISLIAITADRPPYLIDQEDGQTIRQENVFANHIRNSCSIPIAEDKSSLQTANNSITCALTSALSYPKGPVHINMPFEEPLYESESVEFNAPNKKYNIDDLSIEEKEADQFIEAWDASKKVIFLVGVMQPDSKLNATITNFAANKNLVVFAPATSNIQGPNTFNTVESLFYTAFVNKEELLTPDLLVTLGGPVVSKAAKQFLRKYKPKFHFDIDVNPSKIDTYQALTNKITCTANMFIDAIKDKTVIKSEEYLNKWTNWNNKITRKFDSYLESIQWSDLKVFNEIFTNIPFDMDVHLANSTPVRYAELFKKHNNLNYYCNRGTSGIDGTTSTAAGAALASNKPTLLITGDISFFYDSNAFWNNHIPKNLKVILINNGGGNIFKIIRGPENTKQLESMFVTKQHTKTEKLCEAYGIEYTSCNNPNLLKNKIMNLFNSEQAMVVEIFTPSNESAEAYRALFTAIKAK